MRTEDFEGKAEEAKPPSEIAIDELYEKLATLGTGAAAAKPETLPSLTISDRASEAGPRSADTATKPGDAEKTWMASLKPQDLEAATKAFKELGVKASTPAEIAAESKKLVGALASDDYATRERARDALQKVGKAALPAVLSGMTSEDPHVRRECARIADPMLRPAHAIVEAQGKLRDITQKDLELLDREDPTGVEEKRLELRKPLLTLPGGISKEEAESLKRVKDLVTGMEKEAAGRKTGPTEQEKIALEKMKAKIGDQEEAAREVKERMPKLLAQTAGLMADTEANRNGINLKELGDTIKRAIASGVKPDNDHIAAAMARVVLMGGKNPPADVVAAFKKAGGDLTKLPMIEHLQNQNALNGPPPKPRQ